MNNWRGETNNASTNSEDDEDSIESYVRNKAARFHLKQQKGFHGQDIYVAKRLFTLLMPHNKIKQNIK